MSIQMPRNNFAGLPFKAAADSLRDKFPEMVAEAEKVAAQISKTTTEEETLTYDSE